jgi:DNA polymerase III subunit gamma/tau
MGKALYRKYRSRSLDEIVGQDHITSTFKNAIKAGRLSHAYLLTGPRGSGKTSIARILAYEINALPYSDEGHMDIIEIDAASNRRIDEIRDLRDKVSTAPTSAKYKVYIIDEVHMLTKEAFNALLKTLEEPPAHVIFILATTEGHKLPKTIISRTQRFTFLPVSITEVVAHLKMIAKKESIVVNDDALELIAEHGEGSFRDSISLLDQLSSTNETVTKADVLRVLGRAPQELIDALLKAIAAGQTTAIASTIAELLGEGYDPSVIAQQLSAVIRKELVQQTNTLEPSTSIALLRSLLAVPGSHQPKQMLELALFETAIQPKPGAMPPLTAQAQQSIQGPRTKPEPKKISSQTKQHDGARDIEPIMAPRAIIEPTKTETQDDSSEAAPVVTRDFEAEELWQELLTKIKATYNTLYGIARMAKPRLEGDTLHLTLRFAFHIKRLKEPKNMTLLADTVTNIRGINTAIIIEQSDSASAKVTNKKSEKSETLSNISNIFGGAELL